MSEAFIRCRAFLFGQFGHRNCVNLRDSCKGPVPQLTSNCCGRHQRRAAALYESQAMRAAGRKALKPQPTHQAKLLARHLTFRVPLHFAAIPETDISSTCERFGISLETRRRQERAFGLLRKVYAKRAALRGQQPPPFPEWPQPFQNWPSDDNTEE